MAAMNRYLGIPVLAVLISSVIDAASTNCEDLAKLALQTTTIKKAEAVAAGSFTPPGLRPSRIFLRFAAWPVRSSRQRTPTSNLRCGCRRLGWNGKFQGIGNGGFAGSIDYRSMAAAIAHGYATAGTDTGHAAGTTDARWALNHPEKVADFGYRAIHETTDKAKSIVHAFYGDGPCGDLTSARARTADARL